MNLCIAHLSDLHFGRHFDLGVWRSVRHEVARFAPDLLVVSGDLTEEPSPAHLLAAKVELRDLAAKAGAQLFVIPGNHDLYRWGVRSRWTRRQTWYERIFLTEDTKAAEAALAAEIGSPLGFTEACLNAGSGSGAALASLFGSRPAFIDRLPAATRSRGQVHCPEGHNVLLAMFDSNDPRMSIGFASGYVAPEDLLDLRRELDAVNRHCLVRIAVIHHHILPIAFTAGRIVGAEPLMVLQNAGDVLSMLAEHRFDLVLHGHKHKAQFARVDLSPEDDEGYPIAVAGAGSAAMAQSGERGNCLNEIEIEPSGRIIVKSLFYGLTRAPNADAKDYVRTYREPMSAVKRRAFVRARDRHPVRCDNRLHTFEVTENGDLVMSDGVEGLRLAKDRDAVFRRHAVVVPQDGLFVDELLALDRGALQNQYEIVAESVPNGGSPADTASAQGRVARIRAFRVMFPDASYNTSVAYTLRFGCANSMNMTRWEANERARFRGGPREAKWDEEFVSVRIGQPSKTVVLELKLPESLDGVAPYLCCLRHADYPAYALDDQGYVDWTGSSLVEDNAMNAAEASSLRYEPRGGLWRLRLDDPLVGYQYQLRWTLPDIPTVLAIEADVLHKRQMLLDASTRMRSGRATPADIEAGRLFNALSDVLEKLLGYAKGTEKRSVELFAYDHRKLALRPVLNRRSWTPTVVDPDFAIPLGLGIAGAAFQQCRTIPWAQADIRSPLIRPFVDVDDAAKPGYVPMRGMVAIPVFHPSQKGKPRPPPWSAICVVSFGSSVHASKVPLLCGTEPTEDAAVLFDTIVDYANVFTHKILDALETSS